MNVPADAARAPDGETYPITGTFAFKIACVICRIDESSPPGVSMRQQHRRGTRVGGVGDAALDVVGDEGIDDAVDPQLDDLGGAGLRERAVGSERHARRRKGGEHRCASEGHHVTSIIIAPARTDGALPCSA